MSTDSTRRCCGCVDCACALGAEVKSAPIPRIAPRIMSKGARPICISAIPSEVLTKRLQGAEIKAKKGKSPADGHDRWNWKQLDSARAVARCQLLVQQSRRLYKENESKVQSRKSKVKKASS